jgi:hypothetical protein
MRKGVESPSKFLLGLEKEVNPKAMNMAWPITSGVLESVLRGGYYRRMVGLPLVTYYLFSMLGSPSRSSVEKRIYRWGFIRIP